tara:strand:+ start:118 stop:318 length:201 start_codon:yes stop_codon:yes gene_type:complete
MKRPALTWKAIRNLESLWGFAEGEIANYNHDRLDYLTKDALAAIEWIKRLRQWKTEQEKKRKELRK